MKDLVRDYWNNEPCGTCANEINGNSLAWFSDIDRHRRAREPFIVKYAEPYRWHNKNILEVGCGVGSDTVMFASIGANVNAIDISEKSVELTKRNLALRGFAGDIRVADAENMPYKDNYFDFIYSWGVLHHTPDTEKAISEVHRVLNPGGEICVMLYNRKSLVSLQMYLIFGLLRLRPFAKLDDLYSEYHESPGTKVYTIKEIELMFSNFSKINVFNQITCYDMRCGKDSYFPFFVSEFLIPKGLGFFNIVKGVK